MANFTGKIFLSETELFDNKSKRQQYWNGKMMQMTQNEAFYLDLLVINQKRLNVSFKLKNKNIFVT